MKSFKNCKKREYDIDDHFAEVSKIVELGTTLT
jgi:hypothetical protein